MDKKTFIESVEALGYEVYVYERLLKVHGHDLKDGVLSTKVLGELDLMQDNKFQVDTEDNALAKLIVEFGMTTVSEREPAYYYVYELKLNKYVEPVRYYLMRDALGRVVLRERGDGDININEDDERYVFTETMITQYSDATQALFAESKEYKKL